MARDKTQQFEAAHDYAAGVALVEDPQHRRIMLRFDEALSETAVAVIKKWNFHPYEEQGVWGKRIRWESAARNRIDAYHAFEEVTAIIRDEKGIEPSAGMLRTR
jgi:hypothetical protein